jgi:hypothetical protein
MIRSGHHQPTDTQGSTMSSADHIEAAIAAIIASGNRELLDAAAWLSERLPARRQRKAIRAIVAAI